MNHSYGFVMAKNFWKNCQVQFPRLDMSNRWIATSVGVLVNF